MGYAVIVDAGSSGSRLHVYKAPSASQDVISNSLPDIESEDGWVKKTNPGISQFAGNETLIWKEHLSPLVAKAESVVPANVRHETPFFFLATAGLRLLPEAQQESILSTVCSLLQKRTSFYLPECETHVALIDGQTEGLYGWLSLNYLVHTRNDKIWTAEHFDNTYGFMDMGGASAQIAFVPNSTERERHADDLYTLSLRTYDGEAVSWQIFLSTWLGFGANQAQKRYRQTLLSSLSDKDFEGIEAHQGVPVIDPCLPKSATEQLDEIHPVTGEAFHAFYFGDGNFEKCITLMEPLLNSQKPCKDNPCLFDGVHVPQFDLVNQKFVGVSEYWYTAEDLYKLGGKFDYATFVEHATEFCDSNWKDIETKFDEGVYGGMDKGHLKSSCLKSAWVLTILNKGFKFPLNPNDPVAHHNFLDTFQSAAHVDGVEVSWTLGRALLYFSSQIPASAENHVAVGFKSYDGTEVLGGELAGSALPVYQPPASSFVVPLFGLFILFGLVFTVYLRGIKSLNFLIDKVKNMRYYWTNYEPFLPTTNEAPLPKVFSPIVSSPDIQLADIYIGSSTSTQPPSNVPSRVSSRLNMREDWN